MLRAHKDFVIAKKVVRKVTPATPQYAGDIPVETALVLQIGEGVPSALLNTVIAFFPTAGHTFKDEDGSEYLFIRQSNILAYYDK